MLHIAPSHIPLMGNWWHLVMPVVSIPIPDPSRPTASSSHHPESFVPSKAVRCPCSQPVCQPQGFLSALLTNLLRDHSLQEAQWESPVFSPAGIKMSMCFFFVWFLLSKTKRSFHSKALTTSTTPESTWLGAFLPALGVCPCYWSLTQGRRGRAQSSGMLHGQPGYFCLVLSHFGFKSLA